MQKYNKADESRALVRLICGSVCKVEKNNAAYKITKTNIVPDVNSIARLIHIVYQAQYS